MVHDHTASCIHSHRWVRDHRPVNDPPRVLPRLEVLVDTADAGLHPWLKARVPPADRRAALASELRWWLDVAAGDLEFAATFRDAAPDVGQPASAYLHRWLPLRTGGTVLVGIRYLGMDPDLPFVGVAGADRVLGQHDLDALRTLAVEQFSAFRPRFVMLETADPAGAWAGTRPERRRLAGELGQLRRRPVPDRLQAVARHDVDHHERYVEVWRSEWRADPARRRWGRPESRDDLQALADQGLLLDLLVDGAWAGVLAAEPAVRWGVRGATVVELLLDPAFRGQGLGAHLSTLLARALPLPDEQLLLGEVHADNRPAYRAALAAGRVDVGGEVVVPL
jgi:GNAT superfamily N-acetyltransferase